MNKVEGNNIIYKAMELVRGNGARGIDYWKSPSKRRLDLVIANASWPAVWPLIKLFSWIVENQDGGNPIVTIECRRSDPNDLIKKPKIRSMCQNAADLELEVAEGRPISEKSLSDPRVTGFGRYLRKYSLDELPQIKGVITGDWSLIGPRLMGASDWYYMENGGIDPTELDKYIQLMKCGILPGLTGLHGVLGRKGLSIEDRMALDKIYIENATLAGDIRIISRTLGAIVNGNGAR